MQFSSVMHALILALLAFSFVLAYVNFRWSHPKLIIVNRWLRWVLFSLLFAEIVKELSSVSPKSEFALISTGFLVYLLLETMYNWLAIGALSRSDMALFPTFRQNQEGDEWPSHKKFHSTKAWLKDNGFKRIQSIKAKIADTIYLRSSVYEEAGQLTRLQILFIPQRSGDLAMCYIFSSLTQDGQRLITDNVFLPFGGFYPENWAICRNPTLRSIEALFKRHCKRLKHLENQLIGWEDEPLEDLNEQQRALERYNLQNGFLLPRDLQEEHGRISGEGRYRIWKELWLLNYTGIARLD